MGGRCRPLSLASETVDWVLATSVVGVAATVLGDGAGETASRQDVFRWKFSPGIDGSRRKPISKTKALTRSAVQPEAASQFPRRAQGAETGEAGAWGTEAGA